MDPIEPTHIQFEEQRPQQSGPVSRAGSSRIARWLISHSGGLVPDERRAQYVMAVAAVIAVIVALFLFRWSGTRIERGGPGPAIEEIEGYRAVQPF